MMPVQEDFNIKNTALFFWNYAMRNVDFVLSRTDLT